MKRSEMISKLIDAVFMCSAHDLSLDEDEANDLLTRIEKLGMLPPASDHKFPLSGGVHEWEPEETADDADNYCGAV